MLGLENTGDSLHGHGADVMQQQLVFALRLCRLPGTADSTSAQSLHLRTLYCAGSRIDSLLLEELESAGLQELDMTSASPSPSRRVLDALAKVTSLKRLAFNCSLGPAMTHVTKSLAHLTRLTYLCATLPYTDTLGDTLPVSLQHVDLSIDDGGDWPRLPLPVDLRHMTALQHLVLRDHNMPGLKLPPQVTYLMSYGHVQQLSGAAQLLHADLHIRSDTASELLYYLKALPLLQRLNIGLDAYVSYQGLEEDQEQQLVTAMQQPFIPAWASSLTTLCLTGNGVAACECAALVQGYRHLSESPLPKLLNLDISYMHLQCGDLLRLTRITSLTRLELEYPGGLDDGVAASLAGTLTGLQQLAMTSDSLSSVAVLPAVACLTGLSELSLQGGPSFTLVENDLMLLSRLTCLTQLRLSGKKCWSSAGEERFCKVMPHLVTITAWL